MFHKFNCNFGLGKIYCIVGENGCGKSTLINIITGLLYNYSGDVYYNGKNIKDIDMYSLRKENIAVTEQEPRCKILNIYYFIDNQSKKFDEMVNEKSNNISGGEKQKISLIRTFIKNSNVIILDEPTSALDKNTVGSLKEVLVNIKRHKIIIFVTHEDNILSIAYEIIKIKSPTMSENI
ncbi:ATP-binding cassette domain-containing protein [Clostridium sp. LBM24168]